MRLKEPLQGFKMAQGHVLMHWTFFIVAQFFVSTEAGKPEEMQMENCPDEECKSSINAYEHMILAFKTLMYGHLANGILLFVAMYLKRIERRNCAEAIQILVIAIGYGYPILKAIYNLKIYHL